MLLRFLSILTLFFSGATVAAQAEEYRYGWFVYDADLPGVLTLNGPIEQNSVEDFRKSLREHDSVMLALNSPGGSVSAGLELSAIISDRGMETFVPSSGSWSQRCCRSLTSAAFHKQPNRTLAELTFSSICNALSGNG